MLKKTLFTGLTALALATSAHAADYKIDTEGQHAFIQFKIQHLGYSWLLGEFRDFEGNFSYDPDNVTASKVNVTVDTTSLDTNHAERDKHLKSDEFLNVQKYPQATFVSTKFTPDDDDNNEGELEGNLTLHGVTKPITIDVEHIGGGDDPWGGYRQGFEGETTLKLADFNIDPDNHLGPASEELKLYISFEGIRQ
ncbi:YceI family protein [Phytohalomonas tamaricis]|uniref:YceI family protein n=1 Tax=Phytohalomonas tamaricis TaxID=2081032 RepID=UPI000D0BAE4B|nr:YceI family protein [Phytohalomonas tamaricis]